MFCDFCEFFQGLLGRGRFILRNEKEEKPWVAFKAVRAAGARSEVSGIHSGPLNTQTRQRILLSSNPRTLFWIVCLPAICFASWDSCDPPHHTAPYLSRRMIGFLGFLEKISVLRLSISGARAFAKSTKRPLRGERQA